MYILVTPPVNSMQKEKLAVAAAGHEVIFHTKDEVTEQDLKKVDIILGNLQSPKKLAICENLKWIQLNSAGAESYCIPGVLPEGAVLANSTGAYGLAISEHMIGCLFELRKKLQLYYKNQLAHDWKQEGNVGVVEGSTVLVIGLGDIGSTFAHKMKALGCKTIGVKRRLGIKPECVDELYGIEALEQILPRADVVAMCLPGNSSTYHIMDRERIALLKESAIIINIGRGTAIDTDALTEALYAGKIGGAAIDVTDPEPLPAEHKLWEAPNVLITPHVSGGFTLPETLERIVDLFAKNLRRYLSGEEIENVVDLETGYKR